MRIRLPHSSARYVGIACVALAAGTVGCSDSSHANGNTGGHSSSGGSSSGGAESGGASSMSGGTPAGGARAATGGTSAGGTSSGGTAQGGAAGQGTGGKLLATGGTANGGAKTSGGGSAAAGAAGAGGGPPAGWLYTKGNKVYKSDGSGAGSVWVGRGVNVDDIYLCGYNNTLWMSPPEQALNALISGLLSGWKPDFLRISLGMASYDTQSSWLGADAKYKTAMTNVIQAIGAHPNTYVLVTLRSDASMIGQDQADGDPEATGLPSDATTTPNKTTYPSGTDAVYVALVDSFANDPFVLFGLTNEPGGNKLSNAAIVAAMKHAVGTIRAEEDRLGVPHHIVSVQGQGWTSDISFYASSPLSADNVVYEVHGYPPSTSSYTYANLPVIIGEYGSLASGASAAFFADLESKQIPSLAWDFEPYSNCAPDLVSVTQDATTLTPTAWGKVVQSYLLDHAQ